MPEDTQKPDLFEFQKTLLEKEIDLLHEDIVRFDTISFQIKGWAITVWSALLAFGAKETVILVILASIPAMFTFWVMDALFKSYQRRHTRRMAAIEDFLDSSGMFTGKGLREAFQNQDFGNFPIIDRIANRTRKLDDKFDKRFLQRTGFWRSFLVPNVAYFYLLLMLGALIVMVLLYLFTPVP
jgi:hypothetical protein